MKNTIPFILMFLSLGLFAQPKPATTDFVILTSTIDQIEPILLAAQSETRDGIIHVVVYGNEVKQLTSPEMRKYLDWAEKYKVEFSVCQMSLDRFKMVPDSIPKEIKIVDNAFLYSFQLQKKGYKTLNL